MKRFREHNDLKCKPYFHTKVTYENNLLSKVTYDISYIQIFHLIYYQDLSNSTKHFTYMDRFIIKSY